MTVSRHTTWGLLCATVTMGAALSGCGSPAGPRVATAQRPIASHGLSATATASASPKESDYDKALRYTRCMTAHGAVTPDPVVGELLVTVNIIHRGDSEASLRAKHAAFAVCAQFLPATWPVKEDVADAAKERPFRDCVRNHGVAWPEPGANGVASWPTDPTEMTTPAYDSAVQACRHLLDDPANNLPENK